MRTTLALLIGIALAGCEDVDGSLCPAADDLDNGLIYTDPARIGELYIRHRQLEGPYVGQRYINGILPNRRIINYAGLFVYMYWINGELAQFEQPLTDTTELLEFEVGTEHPFESVRTDPRSPTGEWRFSGTYYVRDADDFRLGDCTYSAVRIRREGMDTHPDGTVRQSSREFILIPDLLLRVAGDGVHYGDVSDVRRRYETDEQVWPFTPDASDILDE